MGWIKEKQDLIYQIKRMGQDIANQIRMYDKINQEVNIFINEINEWNEDDVRVNMDEFCVEANNYSPERSILYPKLIDKLGLRSGQKILEVGVGFGDFSLMHMGSFDYYGIDKSLIAVFIAKQRARDLGIPQDKIIYAPEGEYDFQKNFNASFCVSVLHENANPEDVISRMIRHLGNNSKIVCIERLTPILETSEHYTRLERANEEIPRIFQEKGLVNICHEDFFASYTGCDINDKYKFSLFSGEKI